MWKAKILLALFLAMLVLPLSSFAADSDFSSVCETYGFYGLDDDYFVELRDVETNQRSDRCTADDWSVTPSTGTLIDSIKKESQEVSFAMISKEGSVNVRAKKGDQWTGDNYLYFKKSTSSSEGNVFLEITSLSVDPDLSSNVFTRYFNMNGTYVTGLLFHGEIKNTGTRAFDPYQQNPLNPGEDQHLNPWGGHIGCGSVTNPVSVEFEGTVSPGAVLPNGTGVFEAAILNSDLKDADNLKTALLQGRIVPCTISPLSGYSNIQLSEASQSSQFDLYYNGDTQRIELMNFRESEKKRVDSSFQDVQVGTSVTHEIPPAGYEDEVIVTFSAVNNPFPDTKLDDLEGKAAAELYRRAILGGYSDGKFKGHRPVNRAEASKFLLLARFGTIDDNVKNNGKFSDVKEGEWYVPFVMTAAKKGIINGYPDGSYRPQNTVNTAEFLKMLTLTFGLSENLSYSYTDVKSGDWFAKYAGIAEKYDLFPDRSTSLNPGKNLTRKEVAIAIYQYLSNRE